MRKQKSRFTKWRLVYLQQSRYLCIPISKSLSVLQTLLPASCAALVSVHTGPCPFCCSRAILPECAIIWSQFWDNVSPVMKNLGRSGCIPLPWILLCFLNWEKQPVAVLELEVSMCLQKCASTAVCEGSPDSEEQTKKSGAVSCTAALQVTQAQWGARAAQLGVQPLHCWDAWKALRTNEAREHSRDLEAVVEEGWSDKAGISDNQIWEFSAAGELELVLEKVSLKHPKFNKFVSDFLPLWCPSLIQISIQIFFSSCVPADLPFVSLSTCLQQIKLGGMTELKCRPEWEGGDLWGRTSAWDLTLDKSSVCLLYT